MAARPTLTPMIVCKDIEKTYDYFTNVLGFAGQGKMPGPDGNTMHAEVYLPGSPSEIRIMLGPYEATKNMPESGEFGQNLDHGPLGNGVVLYMHVPNVDKFFEFVNANGAIIDEPPTDQFWGDRTVSVLTPDGYYLSFATPRKGFSMPEEMESAVTDVRTLTAPVKAPTPKKAAAPKKAPVAKKAATKNKAPAAKAGRSKKSRRR
ncbi:MAG: VOC family protein [Methanobacteriota archaeon]